MNSIYKKQWKATETFNRNLKEKKSGGVSSEARIKNNETVEKKIGIVHAKSHTDT